MKPRTLNRLSDRRLAERLESGGPAPRALIDEYYRRCIPLYLDFLGSHWHTGFYRPGDAGISPADQVRMIDHIAALAKIGPSDRVLDVGCGIGATLCHLDEATGCEAVGLTPVPAQRDLALQLARERGATIRVDLGHAECLPYDDASFDVVTCFESPCHFADRAAGFGEIARVLKPGGRLAGEDWLATDLGDARQRAEWIEPICRSWAIPMLGDAAEYRRLLAAAGLIDVEVVDMRGLMALERGFAVRDDQLEDLRRERADCADPLLGLILLGLARLGRGVAAGAFTIGRFVAGKPDAKVT